MTYKEPWSKRHKSVTANAPFNLSNSFAEPLESEELINLSIDRGDLDIVEQYNRHSLIYTPNGGSLDLREEIAGLYGPDIKAENIVVFPGAQMALQTAASALLDKDCHSIVFTPSYQSVQEAPVRAGSQVTRIRLHPETNWQINPEAVEAAVQKNTKYIVVNEPNNPTGTLMSHNVQEQIKDIAEVNDIYILSDEVYRLLEHDADKRLPAMADFYKKGISAVTLSKPWGGCGITIGWLALQDLDLRQMIIDTQYFATACPSRASEIQAIMTLRASDKILEKNLKIIRHNIELLDQFIEKYSDLFEWVRPNAGAVAYVKFKGPLTSDELGEQLAKSGISIKPAYVFSEYGTGDSGYFRIGYGEKIMPRALEALSDYVEVHKKTWSS
ncbi:MAG: aminotransferase class I/II-fold pyridoxal phosphate-dependent enzyme [Desulfobacula sp.]|nr:aminotransferase class I/II-fold pyridoxal phosphate-dependent enzyme [Desulfobacula sp.]